MALARVPERFRKAAVLDAATSPSAFLLAGGAAAAAVLASAPLAAVVIAGALGWAGRVALAVPRKPANERVDANRVREPWRGFVKDAQEAQARFGRTVRMAHDGPIKERLTMIGRRIADGVIECWRIARHGDTLQGALDSFDRDEIESDLRNVNEELRKATDARKAPLQRTREALVAQQQSYERLASVWNDARDRLQVLNEQLDEAVARAVELSVHTSDINALNPLTDDVESLVEDLEALRLGLEEAGEAAS